MASDRARLDVDLDFLAILGFILAIILAGRSPALLAVFGGLVFVGWLLVQIGVFDDGPEATGDSRSQQQHRDPLEVLQTRYAKGEIGEAEFEHRLDRIMASTEAVRGSDARNRDSKEGFDSPTVTRSDRLEDRTFDLEGETKTTTKTETETETEYTS